MTIFGQQDPVIKQVFYVLFSNLAFLIYVGVTRPYRIRAENHFDLYCEWMVGLISYQIILFTPYTDQITPVKKTTDQEHFELSWPIIGLIVVWSFVSFSLVIYNITHQIKLLIIRHWRRLKRFLERIFQIGGG